MKTAAKIFLIIGMINLGILIYPIIIGVKAFKKLDTANSVEELKTLGILSLLFVNLLAGIFILCLKNEDLLEGRAGEDVQVKQSEPNNGEN